MKPLINACSQAVAACIVCLFVVGMIVVTACSGGNILEPRPFSNVDDAETRWKAHNIRNYAISQRRSCFCVPQNYPLTLQVDSTGKIVSAKDSRGTAVNTAFGTTIEQMFAEIRRLQNRSGSTIQVKYDSVYGYPRSLYADPIQTAADDEYGLETTLVR